MFSNHCAWNSIRPVRDKVEWWKLVWHKYAIPRFSFILWIVIHDAFYTQNKLRCYGVIQTIQCHLWGGDREDVDHLFFGFPFSHRIWFDLCSRCLVPFRHCFWVNTISWLSVLSRDCSLNFVLLKLMLDVVVYCIWRERNARFHGDAPCTSSMIFRDIVSCIVSKVNSTRNMASSTTNRRRLHIA
jgi:hypothetical protein